jgi:hypothetical protein
MKSSRISSEERILSLEAGDRKPERKSWKPEIKNSLPDK